MEQLPTNNSDRGDEQLLKRMLDGGLTDAEHAVLLDRLQEGGEFREQFLTQTYLHTLLRENSQASKPISISTTLFGVRLEELSHLTGGLSDAFASTDPVHPDTSSANHRRTILRSLHFALRKTVAPSRAAAAMLLGTTLGMGIALGVLAVAAVPRWNTGFQAMIGNRDSIVALMTSFEGTRWTDANMPSSDSNSLVAGQTLSLTSGTAQTTFGFGATVVAQGSTSFTPLSKKSVLLSEGEIMINSPRAAHGFTVKTPRIEVVDVETPFGNHTEFGVINLHGITAVHVFQGEVCFWVDPQTREQDTRPKGIRIKAGEGISLGANESISHQIAADPTIFMPSPSEDDSELVVGEAYVSTIKAAKPTVYWRFEDVGGSSQARNEMVDRWPLQVHGGVVFASSGIPGQNRVEFGRSGQDAWLEADEPVGFFRNDYSVELWAKADAYQSSVLISMLVPPANDAIPKSTGLIQLNGPDTIGYLPGSLRFLHRSPPGVDGGTNVHSVARYVPKQWHHIVATRFDVQLSFFLDGRLVGAERNPRQISVDPRIVIGRLHSKDSASESNVLDKRQFIGCMDEIAIYERALTNEEVEKHFHLGTVRE